jgi:hypothetical protein
MVARIVNRIGCWLLPCTPGFDALRICAISISIGFFFLYFGSFQLESGAAGYESWAIALVEGINIVGHSEFFDRDIGMTLVMLLGGFPWTHSIIGVTIIQVLMGMAMPVLAYFAIRQWFPKAAYYTAIASAASLAPFLLVKLIHHDQPYLFFIVLSLWALNYYVATARPAGLYIMTFAVFLAALIRMVGNGLYPPLLCVCVLLRWDHAKRHLVHYIACIFIFILCNLSYTTYRNHVLGEPHSVVGAQIFYNVYINSSELGVRLSPELGPASQRLFSQLHDTLLPSPAESEAVKGWATSPALVANNYYNDFFFKYDAAALTKRIFDHPNFLYYNYLVYRVADDYTLFMISLEMFRAHPVFVAQFVLRNIWELLYDPGWLHPQTTLGGQIRGGLLFPFGGVTTIGRSNVADYTFGQSLEEVSFAPLTRQPEWLKNIYYSVEQAWATYYHPLTQTAFYFALVTWLSTYIGFLHRLWRAPLLTQWSKLFLSESVLPASFGATTLLFANVVITGALVEPIYRYDYSLLMFKVILACIGVVVVVQLLYSLRTAVLKGAPMSGIADGSADSYAVPVPYIAGGWLMLIAIVAVGFGVWARDLDTLATTLSADGNVDVVAASYGVSCGLPENNALRFVRSACAGKTQCSYDIDAREVHDPAPCTAKFTAEWKCGANAPTRRSVEQNARPGARISLACK